MGLTPDPEAPAASGIRSTPLRPARAALDEEPPLRRRPRLSIADEEATSTPLPGAGAALAVRILLGLCLILDLANLGVQWYAYQRSDNQFLLTEAMNLVSVTAVGRFLLLVPTGIVFLIWFSIAHANLNRMGVEALAYSPGWAVGGFFVPFLNLVRPYQVAQEIWKGSDPDSDREADRYGEWKVRPGSTLILLWWLAYLLSSVLGSVSSSMLRERLSREVAQSGLAAGMLTSVVEFTAGTLLILVIGDIVRRQQLKWELVAGHAPPDEV